MIDYSKLSDFEINKLVAESINSVNNDGSEFEKFFADALIHQTRIGVIDYCNNPSDAWPIILENKISLTKPPESLSVNWHADAIECIEEDAVDEGLFTCKTSLHHYDKNPLRAAMIVYLMMQEGEFL